MNPAYVAAIIFMLACGWRAWVILRDAQPWIRSIGSVFSAIAPLPVFLVVVIYHYAAKRTQRLGAVATQ
ncbi:hypothetical protein [Lysobacter sp. Root494]|uniref:hypothetical protein n=1 Tax=Lysobacter sp. Root494 TaxID=1736549 RepID=UPI0006F9FDB9|nr:hypothetical protein [Lysobacter sp. Root494]KQY51308.1 hypothetical protein ASD14_11040 [Lysobacter sp. Root494]